MKAILRNENGTALVAALFFIVALSLTATVIVWVTGSERRVSHNEYSHVRAFYSSDAGSEQGLNFLWALANVPIPFADASEPGEQFIRLDANPSAMHSDHEYQIDVRHKLDGGGNIRLPRTRPGWEAGTWQEIEYIVNSEGTSSSDASTLIEVQAGRLFRMTTTGY